MSFVKGNLTQEQRKRIEANRQRALERLQRRTGGIPSASTNAVSAGASTAPAQAATLPAQTTSFEQIRFNNKGVTKPGEANSNTSTTSATTHSTSTPKVIPALPQVKLTPEQRKRIEENRQRALEIQRKRHQNNRDAAGSNSDPSKVRELPLEARDFKRQRMEQEVNERNAASTEIPNAKTKKFEPPPINRKDYIEYDFSTMKDTKGGFINVDDVAPNPLSANTDTKQLDEWKEKQQQKQMMIREPAPPLELDKAPKCFECGSIEIDTHLYDNFGHVRVCRQCMREKPDKYSLLTKTECREDYLLTDPELRDTALLPRVEKPNPHGFSRMLLFLRFQVEEYAWKKWGSPEGLDQEWQRREDARLQRRDKKYQTKLREMRKKTRAEEYTRKLRNGAGLGERHVHDWSAPLAMPDEDGQTMVKKRCIDCGVETEEVVI